MKPNVGDLIRGKYRIRRLIGDGGMGSVFEAQHEQLDTLVALKFLHTDLARRPGLAARFAREARVAASIQSPHVTRVNDVDTTEDGTPFIVMELLQGQSLAEVLHKEPNHRLSLDESVDFALQILAGLEAAHAKNIVHRDLKPENVFVTPSPGGPVIKLFDFGIAKVRESKEFSRGLTHAGIMMGTPEYMAPEQLYSAAGVDHRADLYSLGVMLFEMLSGQLPADGDNAAAIVAQVQKGTTRRLEQLMPDLPKDLIGVVQIALAPEPTGRFDSAFAMRQALAHFAGNLSHAGQLAATRTTVTTPPRSVLTDVSSVAAPVQRSVLASSASEQHTAASVVASPGTSQVAAAGALPDTLPPDQTSDGPAPTAQMPAMPAMQTGVQRSSTVLTPAVPAAYPGASLGSPLTGSAAPLVPRRRKGRAWPWVLGALAVALGAGIGIVVYLDYGTPSTRPPPLAAPPPPTPQSPTPEVDRPAETETRPTQTEPVGATSSPNSTTPRSTTPSQPTNSSKPPTQGTGEPSGTPPPFGLPFPIPSTLPPLPSTLPPLPESLASAIPSSFPPFFQPAPEQSPEQEK